jgi:hypothetical protein
MKLESNMQGLNVMMSFNPHNNENNNQESWCDHIEILVNYDRYF